MQQELQSDTITAIRRILDADETLTDEQREALAALFAVAYREIRETNE